MEQTEKVKESSILGRLWKRRSIKLLVCLALFITVFQVAFPIGVRLYLQKWLVENGADKAVIEKVQLNAFSGVAGLHGVDVQKDGKTVFGNSTIFLNIGLTNLFGREALLQRATLRDVIVDVEQYEDGSLRIGSFTIPPGEKESFDSPPEVVSQLEKNIPWVFAAKEVIMQNVTVQFSRPDLKVDLVVAEALLDKISTDPDNKEGTLSLKASVNGAPVTLEVPTLKIAPLVELKGKIGVSEFGLDNLKDFLGAYLGPFSGTASLGGEVAFSMGDDKGIRVEYDGDLALINGDIGGKAWGTKGTVKYNGMVSFVMDDEIVIDVDGDLNGLKASFDMPDPVIAIKNADIGISGKTKVIVSDEVIVDTSAALKLAPTDFSMDILKTSTGDASWEGAVKVETGTESKGLSVRVDGKLQVAKPSYSMNIGEALMEVGNDMLSWDGKVAYIMGVGKEAEDQVQTDGKLLGKGTSFSLPGIIQVGQQGLESKGTASVTLGNKISVAYKGDVTLDTTKVESKGVSIGDKQLTWSGAVEYVVADVNQNLTLQGALNAAELLVDVQESDLHVKQQALEAKTDFSLQVIPSPTFKGSLGFGGSGLEILSGDIPLLSLAEMSISKAGDNGSGGVVIESMAFNELEVPSSDIVPVQVSVPSITLADVKSPDLASASIADLTIEKPRVLDKGGEKQLASLQKITGQALAIDKDMAVSINRVVAEKGTILQEQGKDSIATLGQLDVTEISYSLEQGFVCNTIDLDSVYASFVRKKSADAGTEKEDGADPGTDTPAKEGEAEGADVAPEENKAATSLPVKINQVNVTGKSGFKFTDESMARIFITDFMVESLQVRDIDFNHPEQPFSYALKGMFDKYSPLKVEGTCAPLAKNLVLDNKTTLQNYSMLHASPYVVHAIGTYFPEGRLDLTSAAKIADGEIDMKSNLVFKELVAETADDEIAKQLDNKLPIPLSLALPMLRDSDGTIELDVPLHGKLSDINVGISDIIITALGTAITTAVTPYLAYTALGPAGALAFIGAQTIGKAMMSTNLPSLEFEFGQRELTEEHKKILEKVGKEIEKDKKTSFTICAKVGVSELTTATPGQPSQTSLEHEAIRKELFKLGETRSLVVKGFLLDNFNIKDERLLICNPGIEFKQDVKPIVEFKQ